MSLEERIEGLKAQHRDLETALEQEHGRPSPDAVVIAEMKKQKLRIKDEIAELTV